MSAQAAAPYTVRPMAPQVTVIIPPTDGVTVTVVVPEPLASDLRRLHSRIMEIRYAARFKVEDFDEWIVERLKDIQYGAGVDAGDLDDHGKGVSPTR